VLWKLSLDKSDAITISFSQFKRVLSLFGSSKHPKTPWEKPSMFSPPGRRTGRPLTGLKASGAGAGRSTAAFEPGERELRSKGREARTNRAFNYQEMMWFYSASHNVCVCLYIYMSRDQHTKTPAKRRWLYHKIGSNWLKRINIICIYLSIYIYALTTLNYVYTYIQLYT
jgi:hypothetical protein